MARHNPTPILFLFCGLFILSFAVKLAFVPTMVFDYDFVPIVSLGWDWLHGGAFPVYGTLSSVAAYNMPGLQWLHLPALLIVGDPKWAMVITLLFFNCIGTASIFRLGWRVFSPRVGLLASALFALCDTSLASSTQAWAQLLLPTFFAVVLLCLWEWRLTSRGAWLAMGGVVATYAFMVHFSAILLFPLMLGFAVVTRARWRWRALLWGGVVCMLLLAPYLWFQSTRDFRDIRAFFQRKPQVAITNDASASVPNSPVPDPPNAPLVKPLEPDSPIEGPPSPTNSPNRVVQLLERLPLEIGVFFRVNTFYSGVIVPNMPFYALNNALFNASLVTLALGFLATLFASVRYGLRASGAWYRRFTHPLTHRNSGRMLLLYGAMLSAVGLLVVLRVPPSQQMTYVYGFQAWVILAQVWVWDAVIGRIVKPRVLQNLLLMAIIGLYVAVAVLTRWERYQTNNELVPQVWYYDTIHAVVDWIAEDAQGAKSVTISYDILAEQSAYQWVVAWHEVSADYRLGMSYDFLLRVYHQMTNENQRADGVALDADYVVVFDTALSRYDQRDYSVVKIGRVVVLKPIKQPS